MLRVARRFAGRVYRRVLMRTVHDNRLFVFFPFPASNPKPFSFNKEVSMEFVYFVGWILNKIINKYKTAEVPQGDFEGGEGIEPAESLLLSLLIP